MITEKGVIRTQAVLLAGGAWSGLFCRRHGLRLAQASVKSTSFSTTAAPEVTQGGLSMPDVTIRRRLDGGYTVGLGGRGLLELSPQGLMHARQFWPTFKKRRWGLSFTHRPLVLRRAGDAGALVVRQASRRSSAIARSIPAPIPKLVQLGLTRLGEHYPALANLKVAHSWGGFINSTPDGIPVISAVDTMPGLYLSTGYSGHGFGIGPGAGRLAADLVAGDPPIVDPASLPLQPHDRRHRPRRAGDDVESERIRSPFRCGRKAYAAFARSSSRAPARRRGISSRPKSIVSSNGSKPRIRNECTPSL